MRTKNEKRTYGYSVAVWLEIEKSHNILRKCVDANLRKFTICSRPLSQRVTDWTSM